MEFIRKITLVVVGLLVAVVLLFGAVWVGDHYSNSENDLHHDQDCARAGSAGASQYQKNFHEEECGGG